MLLISEQWKGQLMITAPRLPALGWGTRWLRLPFQLPSLGTEMPQSSDLDLRVLGIPD